MNLSICVSKSRNEHEVRSGRRKVVGPAGDYGTPRHTISRPGGQLGLGGQGSVIQGRAAAKVRLSRRALVRGGSPCRKHNKKRVEQDRTDRARAA